MKKGNKMKNLSILSKIECRGGNEWRMGEYIIGFSKLGYNVRVYCHKSFNNTIKQYINKNIGTEWSNNVYDNMNFKINCRTNEILLLSPVDELSLGDPVFIDKFLIDKQNISKLVVNINWLRKDLKRLQNLIDPSKIIYLCANKNIQQEYKSQGIFTTFHLPTPISKCFQNTKINYDNTTIGRHSRSFDYKFSEQYENIIKEMPEHNFLIMGLDNDNFKKISKLQNVAILKEFEITAQEFLSRIGIFLQINHERYIEMSPRVVVEAMMAGLPVIAENRDGAKDQIIHGETGFLSNNQKDTKKYLSLLLNDKKLRQTIGKNAKEFALKHFVSKIIIKKLENRINE